MRSEDLALLLGRICMAVVFVPGGIAKAMSYARFSGQLATKTLPFGVSLPFPEVLAMLAVVIEIGAPILILLGLKTRWAALLLVAFVIMANLTTHRYWDMEGALRQSNSSSFYKNLGLVGGILFLYASGAGALSWDGWKRRNSRQREPDAGART